MVPSLSGQNARRGLLLVMIEIDPAHEQEFTEWYNKEHLPERVNCPGFLSGRRFEAIEGSPKYLAIYDLASTAVLESAAYRRLAAPRQPAHARISASSARARAPPRRARRAPAPAPLARLDRAGVSDADPGIAQHIAAEIGCPWSADFRDLCFDIRPDLVFAFGRHCDMAAEGAFLAREGIPFVMEKPCGIDAAEVRGLAKLVAERALFAAVPFVWRQSGLVRLIQDLMVGEPLTYLSFRLIAGPPSRYPAAGCAWMLDPKQSGGGCTINLACHFIDLFRALNGGREKVDVSAAVMANAAFRLPVEDYSVLMLSSDDRSGPRPIQRVAERDRLPLPSHLCLV